MLREIAAANGRVTTKTPLRVLLVEDSQDDAELVCLELSRGGYEVTHARVDTYDAMIRALTEETWDLVLSDHSMPAFDSSAALDTWKRSGLDAPFIIVSGSVGEDLAVEAMKAGASDYLVKDNLRRLCPVVRRALEDAANRRRARESDAEAKAASEALEIHRRVADHMPTGVVVFRWEERENPDGFRALWANAAAGRARADAEMNALLETSHPAVDRTLIQEACAKAIESGRIEEIPVTARGEEGPPFELRAVPLGGDLVGIFFEDVSQRMLAERKRKQVEQQLHAAQRMEAVGQLAGGIAHDFNNVLTVINACTEFLLQDLPEDHAGRGDVVDIRDAAERAARLTDQLLTFSRRQPQKLAILNLNETLGDLDKMLQRIIGEDIDLVTKLEPDLSPVRADRSQVEQVLMNLSVNARDAMPKGGRLTLETANVALTESFGAAKGVSVPPGQYVMLAVTDSGIGMDAETQERIFEPFFTKKSHGTGLGLSTVYGIVKQSGGFLWVYSEVGKGTTFKIYLPSIDAPLRWAEPPGAPLLLHGTETLMIVEDDRVVRQVAVRMLHAAGYTVLEASNGQDALRIAERHEGPIHLLLTDVVMPNMSGSDLARALASTRPQVKVLFMSGYTDNAVVHHGVLDGSAAFMQKPFSREGLLDRVRKLIDGTDSTG